MAFGNFQIVVSGQGHSLIRLDTLAEMQEALGIDSTPIEDLEAVTDPGDDDEILLSRDGITYRCALSDLKTYVTS
jgi:hypothetical protein